MWFTGGAVLEAVGRFLLPGPVGRKKKPVVEPPSPHALRHTVLCKGCLFV
jgi:hypothetical protein